MMVPTNDVDFTWNSTSDIGTCFRELAILFHIDYSITLEIFIFKVLIYEGYCI
jgi:hypothetical protein